MIGDGQDGEALIVDVFLVAHRSYLGQEGGKELILKEDDGQHGMLKRIIMAVQLAQHCAQIEVSVCQRPGLVQLQLQLQRLDQIRKGGLDLASASVIASEVIEGGGLEHNRLPGHNLRLFEILQRPLKVLLLQVDHGRKVQILT